MGRKNIKFRRMTSEQKIATVISIAGLILAVLIKFAETGETNLLERKSDEKSEAVITAVSDRFETTVSIDILPKVKSEEECREIYDEFMDILKEKVLADNDSFSEIESNLQFSETLDGYPFYVSYRIRPGEYISRDGKIMKQPDEKVPIELIMTVSCDYFEKEEIFQGYLVNTESEQERFERKILNYLNEQNETDRISDELHLDNTVDNQVISWKVKKRSAVPKVIALCFLAEIFLWAKTVIEKRERIKKRKERIREDYPEFAMKYSLLYNAGLPPVKTLEKIAEDARSKGKNGPLYEEINKAIHESESGLSFWEALGRMADSCDTEEVKSFSGLICQNMRKGGKDIAKDLKKAANESVNMKRDELRKKSETAGTRLTVPMVILLAIVFILIMYPAFSQFSF